MPSERRGSTANRDRGAVAVETAFISILLITLLFGIIESSLLFKDWLGVSAAARAGARMGASQPRSASFAQDSANQVTNALSGMTPANIQEVWVYRTTGTTGKPDSGSFASCSVCVKYTWNAGIHSLAQFSGNWLNTSQNACAGDPLRDSLGVYVKYRHSSPLGFFFNNATVSESTVMWLEPWFATATCKP
jgi:Flp pilus assembly protein TadG